MALGCDWAMARDYIPKHPLYANFRVPRVLDLSCVNGGLSVCF
ncbi:hypothetical protein SOHN41_00609 [Shewanella sp. HN-41]|nr:hypothetical protein SOHN41_00609 [Shewanella sp. HN-41]